MPREFQDFSQEVSQGTEKIVKGLDDIRSAADGADIASGRLSDTQKSGTRIADSYTKTMAGLSRELSGIGMIGERVSRGLSNADSSIRSVGSSLSEVRSGANDAVSGLEDIHNIASSVAEAMDDLSNKKVKPTFDADSAKKARDEIVDFNKAGEKLRKIRIEKIHNTKFILL